MTSIIWIPLRRSEISELILGLGYLKFSEKNKKGKPPSSFEVLRKKMGTTKLIHEPLPSNFPGKN
ncbi:MAG: hypothetical protein QW277_02160 [Methanothermobacter sp.]